MDFQIKIGNKGIGQRNRLDLKVHIVSTDICNFNPTPSPSMTQRLRIYPLTISIRIFAEYLKTISNLNFSAKFYIDYGDSRHE